MSSILTPRVLLFDLYGTLIDIHTDERSSTVWRTLARFLRYRGLPAEATTLRDAFFALLQADRVQCGELYPEYDMRRTMEQLLVGLGYAGPASFSLELAQLMRVLTIRRFGLFADVAANLQALSRRFRLGLISDAQRIFLEPELAEVELTPWFEAVVVSSDYGFRKPDPRLFATALAAFAAEPREAWYIGDNLARDIGGAQQAGLTAIWMHRPAAAPDPAPFQPAWTVRNLDELRQLLERQ